MVIDPDEARARDERYLRRCNEHRFDELGEFVADDVNGPTEGLARYAAGLRDVVKGFPEYRWRLEHLPVDGPWLGARLTGTGTHAGPFRGSPPRGGPSAPRSW